MHILVGHLICMFLEKKYLIKMSLFLIAEIGINHNGDIDIAKKLIDESKSAGFDAKISKKRY